MTADRYSDFETAVAPHVEFLYRVAMALSGDAHRAEDIVVAALEDGSRSFEGSPPDRGLLLGHVYRRASEAEVQPMAGVPFDRLPPAYRDVVLLASLPDVKLADVATALGVPVETARTRRRRAFALLYRRQDKNS